MKDKNLSYYDRDDQARIDETRIRRMKALSGCKTFAEAFKKLSDKPEDIKLDKVYEWRLGKLASRFELCALYKAIRSERRKNRTEDEIRQIADLIKPLKSEKTEKHIAKFQQKSKKFKPEKAIKKIDDLRKVNILPYIQGIIEKIRDSGISLTLLLDRNLNCPEGLKAKTVHNWISGGTSYADPEHLVFLMRSLKMQVPGELYDDIKINQAALLMAEKSDDNHQTLHLDM